MAEGRRFLRLPELRELLSRHYGLGELVDARPITRGYINMSYALQVQADGGRRWYCLRAYRRGVREEELRFEHAIIAHLRRKEFRLAARAVEARGGRTYVFDEGEGRFYALFEFLPGEDRYTWDDPSCSDEELRSAAAVLARFHAAVADLTPEGSREEPPILELLPRIARSLKRRAREAGETAFDRYFLQQLEAILAALERAVRGLVARGCGGTVRQVIHGDYHPGNLKFQDGEVVGLFDFDWSKVDLRAYDVALALVYFCAEWDGEADGEVRLDRVAAFLEAYQGAFGDGAPPGRLSGLELDCLPDLMTAANLYVLNWAVDDFYSQEMDVEEYLRYLRHAVRLMEWLEDAGNRERLRKVVGSAEDGCQRLRTAWWDPPAGSQPAGGIRWLDFTLRRKSL